MDKAVWGGTAAVGAAFCGKDSDRVAFVETYEARFRKMAKSFDRVSLKTDVKRHAEGRHFSLT
ncbi:MAG: hypothetical protein J1F06_07800, partial [Prevotellaceae bacterium]|nr:hypothetical protein [Prevotellaceae bacterium]